MSAPILLPFDCVALDNHLLSGQSYHILKARTAPGLKYCVLAICVMQHVLICYRAVLCNSNRCTNVCHFFRSMVGGKAEGLAGVL